MFATLLADDTVTMIARICVMRIIYVCVIAGVRGGWVRACVLSAVVGMVAYVCVSVDSSVIVTLCKLCTCCYIRDKSEVLIVNRPIPSVCTCAPVCTYVYTRTNTYTNTHVCLRHMEKSPRQGLLHVGLDYRKLLIQIESLATLQ